MFFADSLIRTDSAEHLQEKARDAIFPALPLGGLCICIGSWVGLGSGEVE